MEIVFAAIIWNAQAIHYVPMSAAHCEAQWVQSIVGWHPRVGMKAPLIECMKAKWTCEKGSQLADTVD